jgi:hypothetical protein
MPVGEMFEDKMLNWIALTIDGPLNTAGLIRENQFIGLGVFEEGKYILI